MTALESKPDFSPAQAPPRKRRRKTASGAQEDCFACRRKGGGCDRKRPYCTPCINEGKECPGYKTTLTWNVGVASRGKLRGLSCPVTLKRVDGNNDTAPKTPTETRRRKSSNSSNDGNQQPSPAKKIKLEDAPADPAPPHAVVATTTAAPFQTPFASGPTSTPSSHAPFHPSLPTIHAGQEGWQTPMPAATYAAPPEPAGRPRVLRHPSLQMIQTALGSQYDAYPIPHSGSSVGSYTDAEYHSPLEYPQTPPGSVSYHDPFPHSAPLSYTSQPMATSIDSYADVLGSSIDSLHSASSYQTDSSLIDPSLGDMSAFHPGGFDQDEMIFSPGYDVPMIYNPFEQLETAHAPQSQKQREGQPEEVDQQQQQSLTFADPRFSSPFFHVSPRIQSLMGYYDQHICPYLVAFDGPENPYRKHILQLAMQNEGLQNAIAALSTNNLRMRKSQPPRQISFVDEITDAFDGVSRAQSLSNEPTPEETCYKQMSIDQLNLQLTDVRAAQDDSVFATLLILCLFHVCDSGFSKFKTQLAGVQKLLNLRHPHGQSEFTRWVEMFFIWFDVMTSAVNDREVQIEGESLDMLDYSANLGALEQFSGCDGRLFKLIARLGRLNLLAQGRPVRSQDRGADQTAPRPTTLKRRYTPQKQRSTPHHHHQQQQQQQQQQPPRSLSAADYEHLDGNGWGTPIISSSDEEEDNNTTSYINPTDDRTTFWHEWNHIRGRLQTWQMPALSLPSDLGQIDMLHINESFRYSALLYTERLGHPVLPSSHPNFQTYVSKALFHITSLDIASCVNKFLLWPLFIIGTECVDEESRQIIRSRCIEVQKESGFYNNLSSLEVLERVWREVGNNVPGMEAAEVKARRRDSEAERTGRYGQAFRWRKAMDRIDGEYIVI